MHTSSTLEVMATDVTTVEVRPERPTPPLKRSPHWWRFGKLGLALAFLAAAGYFFHEQVWTTTSLEGTVTSPLITMRSPIDGVVTMNAAKIGAPVSQHEALFVVEAHQVDTRLRTELEAKLASGQQQILVIDRKIAELSTLRTQLQSRKQLHRDATLARLETLAGETTAELNRAKAVLERTQHELSRAKILAAKGLIAQTTLDDAVLAEQQARFEVERLNVSLKRLQVEQTAARNGVMLGEGYSDAPYSQQRIDELAARVIEAKAERDGMQQTQEELASRLAEEQRREAMIRAYTVNAPITGVLWSLHIAADGVVARNAPLADVVDCRSAFVEAMVSERRYDDLQIGEPVEVKLVGNSGRIPGTIQAIRGQSAVVNRDSLAASLAPQRGREAMTVSVAIDPDGLQSVAKGVCQIGRSAKVYFDGARDKRFSGQRPVAMTGLVSSAFAAIISASR
jgi:multidrug resistance efflux pump